MKIVIAPNAFKGTLTAEKIATAISRGVREVFSDLEVFTVPVSDGGDGILETLLGVLDGEKHSSIVNNPLRDPIEANWGVINNGKTVFIETALAFGLALIPEDKWNPAVTTSRGIGDIIRVGLNKGIRDFMIAVGGSANNDGGTGMMKALGVKFLDKYGDDLPDGGLALQNLDKIDISGIDPRLKECTFTVLSDSTVPLTGETGVSIMYSPGKGASIEMAQELDKALVNYAEVILDTFGIDMKKTSCGGAGGGVVCAAQVFLDNLTLELGIDVVLKELKFNDKIKDADLIITGEGCIDIQTIYNKAPIGVAKRAKLKDIPVLAVCAILGDGYEKVYEHGISSISAISGKNGWGESGSIVD